ncbi:MAG: RIP metalloprotease RseP [Acidobacteria bacterium RIFCSPLOWO2_12_FULL_66_10]|nr:MAG: RIP metalloprotease RseP [Acidobacteria bacterium RIFCSPLOWO2_12_FULL_66_10]
MTTLLAFAFVLGVLVFVHELGHFLAAKRVGIRVLKFQLGFNPTVISFRRGDTEYGIGALPLGGYVKMAGENPEEERTGQPDEFLSKTKWQRFQVLIMGPVMNLALALLLTAIVLYQGAEKGAYEDQPPVVGVVVTGSPAERAGIQPGDRLVSVADHRVDTWEQFLIAVGTRPNREVSLGWLRNGLEVTKKITPVSEKGSRFEIGDIGVLPNVHPHVRSISAGEAAERAGLKAGDVVVSIDGQPITFSYQLRDVIAKHPEQAITLSILRDGQPQTIVATPAKRGNQGLLGIGIGDETVSVKPGLIEAVGMSLRKNIEYGGLIFQTVWGLITRETSPKQLMGPVAIAQLSGESAQLGWIALFSLMASISLNLGILNLLPIPVLDGGHILIMGLEGLARRDFSVRMKEKMLLAGFVVLMMLMVTVIYNDLTRISWIERLMPWR